MPSHSGRASAEIVEVVNGAAEVAEPAVELVGVMVDARVVTAFVIDTGVPAGWADPSEHAAMTAATPTSNAVRHQVTSTP